MNAQQTPRSAEQSFPGTPGSIADMRTWARTWLAKLGVPGAAAEDAVLVLSELCTNAVLHTRSSRIHGSYLVVLRRGVSMLRMEVTDAGGVSEPRARRHGPRGNGRLGNACPPIAPDTALADFVVRERGHGLALVEAFTTRWWTRGNPSSRTVGAELPLEPSA
jgi:anti-sigma regulatory factor (Ser/Thr protein kinase)